MEPECLNKMAAMEMLASLEAGDVSAVALAEASLARMDAVDEELNAFCALDQEKTLAMAHAADERRRTRQRMGLLDGLPVAVKDVFDMISWPTRNGSRLTSEMPQDKDAPTVASCRRHGFVPVGKTTVSEFGWKAVTDSPLTGVTRNPWNTRLTPGGSSGGSAAAVAAGVAPVALGADSGGSVRIPASFCGLVGIKPTHGRAPMHPGSHYGKLSQPGPMARTVRDAVLLLDVITEDDPSDPRLGAEERMYRKELEGGVRGMRIAHSPSLGLNVPVHPEVADAVEHAAIKLEQLGGRVMAADPDVRDLRKEYECLFFTTSALMAKDWSEEERQQMDPQHHEMVTCCEHYSAVDYLDADSERVDLMHRMSYFHQDFDLLLTPTVPIPPFEAGRETPEDWPYERWTSWTPFTWPWNMTGQPAMTIPCGFTSEGLPIGVQLIAARHNEHLMLSAAFTLQQALPLTDHWPPMISALEE